MDEQTPKRGRGRYPKPQVTTKAVRGRPRYQPAKEQKELAVRLLCVGETHDHIAKLLGISTPTFQLRFAAEITDARLRKRADFLGVVFERAMAGNAAMLKLAIDLTAAPGPDAAPYQVPVEKPEVEAKPVRIGKKEQQALAAANPDLASSMGKLMAARAKGERPN